MTFSRLFHQRIKLVVQTVADRIREDISDNFRRLLLWIRRHIQLDRGDEKIHSPTSLSNHGSIFPISLRAILRCFSTCLVAILGSFHHTFFYLTNAAWCNLSLFPLAMHYLDRTEKAVCGVVEVVICASLFKVPSQLFDILQNTRSGSGFAMLCSYYNCNI